MPEFHETKMGHIFYEVTMPDIAKSLKEIARLLMVIGCQSEEKEKKAATKEVDEISLEDLEAASDHWDELMENASPEVINSYHKGEK